MLSPTLTVPLRTLHPIMLFVKQWIIRNIHSPFGLSIEALNSVIVSITEGPSYHLAVGNVRQIGPTRKDKLRHSTNCDIVSEMCVRSFKVTSTSSSHGNSKKRSRSSRTAEILVRCTATSNKVKKCKGIHRGSLESALSCS